MRGCERRADRFGNRLPDSLCHAGLLPYSYYGKSTPVAFHNRVIDAARNRDWNVDICSERQVQGCALCAAVLYSVTDVLFPYHLSIHLDTAELAMALQSNSA